MDLRFEEKRGRRMAEHAWSGLTPSCARISDAGRRRPDLNHAHPRGSLRGTDQWTPTACSDELSWGVVAAGPGCLGPPSSGLEVPSAPGALKRLVPDHERAAATKPGHGGVMQQRQGWKRFSILIREEGKTDAQRHYYRFDNTPCSELKLDEELTMFESQITRTVTDHLSTLTSRTSLCQEMTALVNESNSGVTEAGSSGEKLTKPSEGKELKRQRSAVQLETDGQGGRGWVHPLKLLVRKGLTVSDVGELGRIIIPKKDAENQSFPQIDSKEGAVLELEDYSVSKRWRFRFKYWINNKSRMYVLENTGEFIKYHSLQEHDMFYVYEDGFKKLGSKYCISFEIYQRRAMILDMDLSSNLL